MAEISVASRLYLAGIQSLLLIFTNPALVVVCDYVVIFNDKKVNLLSVLLS